MTTIKQDTKALRAAHAAKLARLAYEASITHADNAQQLATLAAGAYEGI